MKKSSLIGLAVILILLAENIAWEAAQNWLQARPIADGLEALIRH